MGTPAFAVPTLKALVAGGYGVVGVYTQPDKPSGRGWVPVAPPVKQFAMESGLKVLQPSSLKKEGIMEEQRELRPDVIVVAAYGLILPRPVLDLPPFGTLNVHPSLLPRHRGPSPIAGAILEGDEITGVTIMVVESRVDSGPVLSSRSVSLALGDTTGSLSRRLADVGAGLLLETLPRWLKGEIDPQPQEESRATYSRLISKQDGEIDWRLPAVQIERRVRAFDPWPGTYTHWRGKLLKVLEAQPLPDVQEARPGEVFHPAGQARGLGVGTGEGALLLKRVQLEGRKASDASSFILGHRDFLGDVLPS